MKKCLITISSSAAERCAKAFIFCLVGYLFMSLTVLSTLATEIDPEVDLLQMGTDYLNIKERGGPSIVDLIWGSYPPSEGIVVLVLGTAGLVLGYGLYRALLLCQKPNKPAFSQGIRWAAFTAIVLPNAALIGSSQVTATETFFKLLVILVSYCAVAFALGSAYWHFKDRLKNRSKPLDEATRAFYSSALQELNLNTPDAGLWAQCLAKAKGDEAVAKANYLTARAADLSKNAVAN